MNDYINLHDIVYIVAACLCNADGTISASVDYTCDRLTGSCTCKKGVEGAHCNECPYGMYWSKGCLKCDCPLDSSDGNCTAGPGMLQTLLITPNPIPCL